MIIPEKNFNNGNVGKGAVDTSAVHGEEAPPQYEYAGTPTSPGSSSPSRHILPNQWLSRGKPTNFVTISRNVGGVEGLFIIDPTLLPPTFTSRKAQDPPEKRKNLHVGTHLGTISVDIAILDPKYNRVGNVLPANSMPCPERVELELKCNGMGSVDVRVHSISSSNPRLPFRLVAGSHCGSVSVQLPRSFTGLISMSSSVGSTELSAALKPNATIFYGGDKHVCFVGDAALLNAAGGSADAWKGDEVKLTSSVGSVSISYDDEAGGLVQRVANYFRA